MFSKRWCDGVRQRELKFCRCLPLSCLSEGFHISEHKSFIALTQCSVSHGLFIKWGVAVYQTANPAYHRYRQADARSSPAINLQAREPRQERHVSFVWLMLGGPERRSSQVPYLFSYIKIWRSEVAERAVY